VLASLLPGLRELRAPLACGYVWLLTAWLALSGVIPRPADARTGMVKDLYEIASAAGRPAVTVAASFAAYLIGVLSVQTTQALMPWLQALRHRRLLENGLVAGEVPPASATPSAAGRQELRDAVLDQLTERVDTDPELREKLERTQKKYGEARTLDNRDARRAILDVYVDVEHYVKDLVRYLPVMPLRLLGDPQVRDIYGEFDRNRAEAEFRGAVAFPLLGLLVVLAVRSSPWWVLGVTGPALLLLDALNSATAAADLLAESIRARAAESPALAAVRSAELQPRTEEAALEKAAMIYPIAMIRFARSLEERDALEAKRLYLEAAQGPRAVSEAMMRLAGLLHLDNDPEAEAWYDSAADAGDPDATMIRQLRGKFSLDQLSDLKAAYSGKLDAMCRVGGYYENKEMLREAKDWYGAANKRRYPDALAPLTAVMRKLGEGPEADALDRDAARAAASADLSDQRTVD
jgi:hypothetical protein